MNQKELVDQLNFLKRYRLNPSKIEVLLCIMEGQCTNEQIARKLSKGNSTIYFITQSLRDMGLIRVRRKNIFGTLTLEMNPEED